MNAMTKINPAPNTDRALGDILARQRAAFLRDGTLRSPRGAAIS
jgi:hypothetical protein